MTNKEQVLVVDDEMGIRNLLKAMLQKKGYGVETAESAEQAFGLLSSERFDLVITDLRLPGLSGEELLLKIKRKHPNLPVVVISAFGSTKNVVEVIKKGAEDYLPKPFTPEDLEVVTLRALEKRKLLEENEKLRREITGVPGPLIGKSRGMIQAKDKINRFSKSEAHVLITGESGVGKGLAANAIHQLSPRSQRPFLEINAGAIPATLFESELFGVRKGAFTGATETREGLFQSADGGTLFLDEIAEVPLEAQSKLLRVLDSGEIRPVGETRSRKVNVRLIAATNQDLEERVESKTFRQDLYYRLSILLLPMPSLRERPEDIPLLAEYFLNRLKIQGNGSRRLSSEAQIWLMAQKWPGNVRELKNVLERAVLLSDQEEIGRAELSAQPKEGSRESGSVFKLAKKRQIETFEKNYVTNLLKECGGNVSKAAEKAGLARRNFQALIKKYKLNPALHRKKP